MSAAAPVILNQFPECMAFLFEPWRYKVAYGGRYGVKSWSIARALLSISLSPSLLWPGRTSGPRILCARETQKSIEESVHHLLSTQIEELGLTGHFVVQRTSISCVLNGAEFIFAGIRQNINNIKSYEGCDIVWIEEAATVSKNSLRVLIPTIRKDGSEIWISFNPELETDEVYQHFIVKPPASAKVVKTTWRDNPWMNDVIRAEMRDLKERDPDDYEHVYEGMCKQTIEGSIYKSEITAIDKEERIMRVPYDAGHPVHTFWDLGYGDNTSIWFIQSIGFEFRVIDFLSASLKGLSYYVKELKERPYVYGMHFLPHDAKAHELGSGKTIEEQMKENFSPDSIRVAKKLSIVDGINAVRIVLAKSYFDREKTADGIQALRHYRYDFDEDLRTFRREPLHDWASHPADAFRTFAVSIKDFTKPEPPRASMPEAANVGTSDGGWMS